MSAHPEPERLAKATDSPEDLQPHLERTWAEPRGLFGPLRAVHHTTIGKRYIITAFCFFILGGLLAGLMRLQLSRPESHFLSADRYNQVFTMHGSTMMFLFAVPMLFEAMGVYLVPLMVGTRNIALPRLNAFSYYVYLFGGILLYVGFLTNTGPDTGWFSYVTLAGPDYSPGKRVDIWAQMITFTELSALAVAVEVVVTIMKLRAPGMSLNRIPLFVWSILITAVMVIFAMPAVMLSSTFLILDRLVATHFFNPAEGGDVLLYQHLFWWFGHPEVYIIFIPALGIVSTIVSAFSRRRVFGYTAMVLSMVATGFVGFGLWVHHMFATGLPQLGQSYFTAASMMIAIPSGIQIFCWIATLWGGKVSWRTPLLFVLGFIFIFVAGGMTGVMLASVPLDWQVHDTYFVVAHFHYVLIGGAVFPLFGGLHFWFPKLTGRMYSEKLGIICFVLMFIGFNLTFFPMHLLGMKGMVRRVYTYQPNLGLDTMNLVASLGAVLMVLGVAAFLVNVIWSRKHGEVAEMNPWGASGLEWAVPSPPPKYNFVELPTVAGRDALWDAQPGQPIVTGVSVDSREVLSTKVVDADPDHIKELPEPSVWPFLSSLAVTAMFIGSIFNPWAVVWFTPLIALTMTLWFWPTKTEVERHKAKERYATTS